PTRAVASSDFEPSKNSTSSSEGDTTNSGAAQLSNSCGATQASSVAVIWLYQNRRDRDGGLRVSRIDWTIRSGSSQIESPRIARTTSGAASADSGASGGASSESYKIPVVSDSPADAVSHASRSC